MHYPPLLPPVSAVSADTEWPSIASAIAETPYQVPLQFDIVRVRVLVNAKRLELEDHIWSLREDPGYFQDFVGEWSEHRPERVLNANGSPHHVLGKPLFWERVLSSVVVDAYGGLLVWNIMEEEVKKLSSLRQRYGEILSINNPLPKEYTKELCHFAHLLQQMRKGPISNFRAGIAASPPLRSDFLRAPQEPNSTIIKTMSKQSPGQDYLLWLIFQLADEHQTFLCGLSNLLDELERVSRSNSESGGAAQKERISPWISRVLSDLSVISELEWRLSLHQPGIGLDRPVQEPELFAEFSRRTALLSTFYETAKTLQLADIGSPLRRFDYPSEKRRTAILTAKLRDAENELDQFWEIVDNHFMQKIGMTVHQLLSTILKPRVLKRTPEWVEPIPNHSQQAISTDAALNDDFSVLDIQERTERTLGPDVTLPTKTKPKTRGPPVPKYAETVAAEDPSEPVLSTVIPVSKRALKVFSVLFHNSEYETPPGEILWSEFLHALSSAGFAVEKQYGSAWMFTPPAESGQRSIIFHEPHPSNKIPLYVARRYGRRLERVYGWTCETFINAR